MKGKFTGGRKVGSKNKLTKVNRAFVSDLLSNQGDSIELALKDLQSQNKAVYLNVICRMLEMIIPKLKEQDIEENEDEKRPHIFKLSGGNKITFNSTDN